MKRYIVEVCLPNVYMIKAENAKQARKKAIARWQKAHHTTRLEPKVEIVLESGVGLNFWNSVDAAIDDYKERTV